MSDSKIKIQMLPAGNGDAILLQLNNENWLVDSGYIKQTYRECLRPLLMELQQKGEQLDRLIITHIDGDHISGATALIAENESAAQPKIIPIKQIWHNSYRHIQFADKVQGELSEEEKSRLRQRTKTNHLKSDVEDSSSIVSTTQGSTLAAHLYADQYQWNSDFDGNAVACEEPMTMQVGDEVLLTLLSPNNDSLEKLGKKWKRELMKKGFRDQLNEDQYFDDALEYLMADERSPRIKGSSVSASDRWIENIVAKRAEHKEDSSATNASSISFLLEHAGKKILMLGDALPSQVIKQLKWISAKRGLDISKDNPFKVDVMKLSHHGGFSNNSPELFDLVVADNYLVSTNGRKHYHPHIETLAWLIQSHPSNPKRILFNYTLNLDSPTATNRHQEDIKKIMDKTLWEKYNYEVVLPAEEGFQHLELFAD